MGGYLWERPARRGGVNERARPCDIPSCDGAGTKTNLPRPVSPEGRAAETSCDDPGGRRAGERKEGVPPRLGPRVARADRMARVEARLGITMVRTGVAAP